MSDFNFTISGGSSKRLLTKGKYCPADIVVTAEGGGGGGASVKQKDINFYDYDGTRLHSFTLDEFAAVTELPELPTQKGLICQGWNWDIADIKAMGRAVDVGATYITDDGKTRVYIRLEEERKSPVLGVAPNGTVTVDWGDGTAPDTLTGTGNLVYTPNHEYAAAGDYVITLTANGTIRFMGTSTTSCVLMNTSNTNDAVNYAYANSIRKIEFGAGVSIGNYVFYHCCCLQSITIPNIESGNTANGSGWFGFCPALKCVIVPKGITTVGADAFTSCQALNTVVLPYSVTSIGSSAFSDCNSLENAIIPDKVYSIGASGYYNCCALHEVVLPSKLTSLYSSTFNQCRSLCAVIFPASVTSIANAFGTCYAVKYYDFTRHTKVPTLSSTYAIPIVETSGCEIRVPAALYDEWIAATNWSSLANNIVAR